jgi:hypothetical protein
MKTTLCLGAGALLSLLGGCGGGGQNQEFGTVIFDYVLVDNDGAGNALIGDCNFHGVEFLRFSMGDDLDGNGELDEDEEAEFLTAGCNQSGDLDGDGALLADGELGQFDNNFTADSYTSFAIQAIDFNGNPIFWSFAGVVSDKFTFNDGITIAPNTDNLIPFVGDANQQGQELQILLGF